jgi:ribosome-associated translation inhibitor RaiA
MPAKKEDVMRAKVHDQHGSVDPPLRSYVERRTRLVLGRFSPRVQEVVVRVVDVNGPKGGTDKRCRVEARLRGLPVLVVEDEAASTRQAVDAALDRMGRTIDRTVTRERDLRLYRRGDLRMSDGATGGPRP